jgi:hypothetical protein
MRKQIVAGNWKMNLNAAESQELIAALKAQSFDTNVHVAIATALRTPISSSRPNGWYIHSCGCPKHAPSCFWRLYG